MKIRYKEIDKDRIPDISRLNILKDLETKKEGA